MTNKLIDAITGMQDEQVLTIAREIMESGADPMAILDDCRTAMEVVGQRFGAGEYFLPELILAGEMMRQVSELIKPRLTKDSGPKKNGKVVVGTVKGDIHDIGKDIVVFMLDIAGFDVTDLGVDVPAEKFVEAITVVKPQVVALSALLTLAFDSMKATVDAIKEAGLRDSVKIMVGGGAIDDSVRVFSGADAYGADAMAAVTLSKKWIGGS